MSRPWTRSPSERDARTSVGELLRDQRVRHDLTLEDLAARSGISDRAISDIERGVSRGPRKSTVQLLCDALGLRGEDRTALLRAARDGRAGRAHPGPRLLPLPVVVRHFVGRRAETAYLAGQLAAERPGPPSLTVVTGAPGIGKTALAVASATGLARAYDDTFFLDLRALTLRPRDPRPALRHLVRAARPDVDRLPAPLADLRALWNETFVQRRILVVLDDARDEPQVRPLLPDAGRGALLITSRRPLAGLEGAHRLDLPALAERESVALLRRLVEDVGPGQALGVRASDLVTLARLCEHTPLALRAAGSRIAARRGASVVDLNRRLQSRDRRLAVLTAGDLKPAAVLEPSYAQLSPTARILLRRLGAIEGTTFCASLAAVLLDTDLWIAEDAVDELVEVGFAGPGGGGAFEVHGLVKLYASTLHADEGRALGEGARVAARAREWQQFAGREEARGEVRLG